MANRESSHLQQVHFIRRLSGTSVHLSICLPLCLSVCLCAFCVIWVWELSAVLCSPGGGEAAFRNLYGCHKAAFMQLNSCFLQPGTSHPNSIGRALWVTTLPALVCKALCSKNTNGWINKAYLHGNIEGIRDSVVSKDGVFRISAFFPLSSGK